MQSYPVVYPRHSRVWPIKAIFYGHRIWIWNIIGFGAFADRIIAEPKSNRSILWDMEVCNDLNGVCAFL